MELLKRIQEQKIIAILRGFSCEETLRTAEALLAGGVRMVEVTYDYGGDLEATPKTLEALATRFGDAMDFGAGTVLTPEAVTMAAQAGARYIITPNVEESVICAAKEQGLLAMPGTMTPTEVVRAKELGADIVKIFPAANLGPDYIRALRGPLGFIPMAAVGGIDAGNAAAFLAAGVCCLGAGGRLADKAAVRAGDYDAIRRAAQAMTEAVRAG